MHDTTKTCLFGGALFAAGVAQQANANIDFELNFGGAYPSSLTVAYVTDGSTYFGSPNFLVSQYISYSPATSPVPAAAVAGYGYAAYGFVSSTYMASTAYGTSGGGVGAGIAIGQSYAYFTAGSALSVTISWDFSNEFGTGYAPYAFYSDISLVNWTAGGVTVFSVDPSANPLAQLSGSVTINLAAGTNYSLLLESVAAAGDGSAFANATFNKIPTPASAAMLGLAGLVATRRRR